MSNRSEEEKAPAQILVVDDSSASLKLLTTLLTSRGYQVRPASTGHLALRSVAMEAPDLILLDVKMPDMDGYEVARRLKAGEQTSRIPVIFISGLDDVVEKVKGFGAGGVDYITKPFDPEDLLARIASHLQLRMLQKQLEEQNLRLQQEITERERVEAALQEAHSEMERRVAERTAELALANASLKAEITEHERAEEERIRLVTAIEQCAEGIFITDKDYTIQYVNPAFERMTGYDGSEIVGRHARLLKSDKHDIAYYAGIRESLVAGTAWSGHHTSRRKDGTYYEVEAMASPVRDNSGTIINYVGIHRDITLEVKLERELRQAQKMEAIGTLAGGIAHDFNNILAAIIGYTEMVHAKLPPDSPLRRKLAQVLRASQRATDLVKQILAFSRQGEQERKPLQIGLILKEALKLLRSSLPTTIEIRHDLVTDLERCVVMADPTQIHQVLMNLCTNAAHAMRARGGVLSVSLAEVDLGAGLIARYPHLTPGRYASLKVSDTGCGMDAVTMERVFEPYFTTKAVGEGTGLGLAVVRGIVRGYDGAVTVHSVPGEGTVFDVLLPVVGGANATTPKPFEELLTGRERILLIDDEETMVALGKEMLEPLGYRVRATTSGDEALKAFRSSPEDFDLIITDMTMPHRTGSELAREFMAIRPNIPVILCTGYSEQMNEAKAREAGIRAFVMKPYVIANFAKAIRRVLDEP